MEKFGRYEILKELGHGAMGVVYKATDPMIDRVVAIKTILAQGLGPKEQKEYRERFFREARAAGKLSHPGIVTIYDVGEDEATQTPYIVMEFITGRTLESLLQAGEGLTMEKTIELVQQIAEALDHAHAHGIVHRDVKPANILVTEQGRAKIADFGIARFAASQFTQAGQMLGTPSYMSPEQLSGGQVDGRSDIFSLGVILYSLLTGDKPFTGDTISSISFKIVYTQPVPPRQLNIALPEEFNYVVARALAKDPAARYQTCRELIEDLDDIKHGQPPRWKGAHPLVGTAVGERTVVRAPAGPAIPAGAVQPSPVQPVTGAPIAGTEIGVSARLFSAKHMVLAGSIVLVLLVAVAGFFLTRRKVEPAGMTRPPQQSAPATPLSPAPALAPAPAPTTAPTSATTKPPASATAAATAHGAAASTARTATLIVDCKHNLRSGILTIFSSGRKVYEGQLGGERHGLKSMGAVQGRLRASVRVPAGNQTIRVQISSPAQGFDQSQETRVELPAKSERRLEIGLGKGSGLGLVGRKLTLRWR